MIAALVLASFCYGLGIVLAKPAMHRLGLRRFLLVRCLAGLAGAAVICPWPWRLPSPEDLPLVALSVLVCPIVLNVVFFHAMRRAPVARVDALRHAAPLWTAALALVLFRNTPGLLMVGALVFIVYGVVLQLRDRGGTSDMSARRTGTVYGLLAGALQGGAILLQAEAVRRVGGPHLILYQNVSFFAALLLIRPPAGMGRSLPAVSRHWRSVVEGIALALLSGLLTYVIGEAAKLHSLPSVPGPVAMAVLQLALPFSALVAWLLLGERPRRREVAAMAVITVGCIMAAFAR